MKINSITESSFVYFFLSCLRENFFGVKEFIICFIEFVSICSWWFLLVIFVKVNIVNIRLILGLRESVGKSLLIRSLAISKFLYISEIRHFCYQYIYFINLLIRLNYFISWIQWSLEKKKLYFKCIIKFESFKLV